jgi:predicted acyl esterase
LQGHFQDIDLPILHITGWFDVSQCGQFFYWQGMAQSSPARDRQWLLVGPWSHAATADPQQHFGGRDFGMDSLVDMRAVHLRFFDHRLKGIDKGSDRDRRVRIFRQNETLQTVLDAMRPAD